MPIKTFATGCTVRLRPDPADTTQDTYHTLPLTSCTITAAPDRPDGPPARKGVDGIWRERRADGWYLHADLQYEHLSQGRREAVINLVDALHARASATEVHFCPDEPFDADIWWRVVPSIDKEAVRLIYANRVQERPAVLSFKGYASEAVLPGWLKTL